MQKKLTFIYKVFWKIVLAVQVFIVIIYSSFRKIKFVKQAAAFVFIKIQYFTSSISFTVTERQCFLPVLIKQNKCIKATAYVIFTSIKQYPFINSCFKTVFKSYITRLVNFEKFIESKNNFGFYWVSLNQPPIL